MTAADGESAPPRKPPWRRGPDGYRLRVRPSEGGGIEPRTLVPAVRAAARGISRALGAQLIIVRPPAV